MADEKDRLVRDQPTEMPTEQGPLAAYKGGLRVLDAEYRELPAKEAAALSPLLLKFQEEAKRFTR